MKTINLARPVAGKAAEPPRAGKPAMVVGAVLMPHAPILVPPVGGRRGEAARASCQAMRTAATCVMDCRPGALVLISPHSPRKPRAFGIWAGERLQGSFAQFDAPDVQVDFPGDPKLADAIIAEATSRGLETWAVHDRDLDHGALVPLWFLAEAGWAGPTIVLGLNGPETGPLIKMGQAIAAAARSRHRRVAIIASGDMSHRLTPGAPCGFHPLAHRFDETLMHLIRHGDYHAIENMNADLRDLAAEDAVDSTLIAAAAADWNAAGHRILNYEGPFGVGYGVAILFAGIPAPRDGETSADPAAIPEGAGLPALARLSVEAALRGSSHPPAPAGGYLHTRRGVFVTVRRRDGALRGCAGTVVPACDNLVEETWRSARVAAFGDSRFPPVASDELPDLRFDVRVLHPLEEVSSAAGLDPARYGVVISTEDGRHGLLLPGLAEIKTPEQQLHIARMKGQIGPGEPVKIQRFQVDHFADPTG